MRLSLEKKLDALEKAENEVITELERLYPKGSDVNVFFMNGQIYPSAATVVGHDGGQFGYVRVRLHKGKKSIKRITPGDIIV